MRRDHLGRKEPSRRDLLLVIGELQNLLGRIQAADNDRNPNRQDDKGPLFEKALELCIDARSFDPPIEGGSRGGWPYPGKSYQRILRRVMRPCDYSEELGLPEKLCDCSDEERRNCARDV